jgi:hypothetical protein
MAPHLHFVFSANFTLFRQSVMSLHDIKIKIQTLGRFRISVNGTPVAEKWPDEMLKIFFCSLLSPLDLYFTWDRISRAMLSAPLTRTNKNALEGGYIRPLNSFLISELGFSPLVTNSEYIRIDQQNIHVDAHEFHDTVLDGLRLLSFGTHAAALEKFTRADVLYSGKYLPEISGKIIQNTRNYLESFYRTAVMDAPVFVNDSAHKSFKRRVRSVAHY